MVNESRACVTQCRPVIAKSHEAGAEHAHMYSILAGNQEHDGDGDSAKGRRLGDVFLLTELS